MLASVTWGFMRIIIHINVSVRSRGVGCAGDAPRAVGGGTAVNRLSRTRNALPRVPPAFRQDHPARGPYYLGETQIAALLAQLGLVATVYQEVGRVGDRVLTTQRVKVIYHATLIEIAQH